MSKITVEKFSGVSNALLEGINQAIKAKEFKELKLKFIGICISEVDDGMFINVGGNIDPDNAPKALRRIADKIEEEHGVAPSIKDLMEALKEVLSDEIGKLKEEKVE